MQTKNKQVSPTFLKYITIYGYALFAALILVEAVSIILLFLIRGELINNSRVVILYAAVLSATLLLPIISYLIGFYMTAKNKMPYFRQFTGVVLGVTGVWLAHALQFIPFRMYVPRPEFIPMQVHQFSYAIITVLVMLLIAVVYRGVRSKQPFYRYPPVALVLIGSLITWFFFQLTGGLSGNGLLSSFGTHHAFLITSMAAASVPLAYLLAYSYSPTKTKDTFDRIIFSGVLTAFYLMTVQTVEALINTTFRLMNSSGGGLPALISAYIIALIIWGAFIYFLKRRTK